MANSTRPNNLYIQSALNSKLTEELRLNGCSEDMIIHHIKSGDVLEVNRMTRKRKQVFVQLTGNWEVKKKISTLAVTRIHA